MCPPLPRRSYRRGRRCGRPCSWLRRGNEASGWPATADSAVATTPLPTAAAGLGQPISPLGAAAASVTLAGAPHDTSPVPAYSPLFPLSADLGEMPWTPASPLLLLPPAAVEALPVRLGVAAVYGAAADRWVAGCAAPASASFDAAAVVAVRRSTDGSEVGRCRRCVQAALVRARLPPELDHRVVYRQLPQVGDSVGLVTRGAGHRRHATAVDARRHRGLSASVCHPNRQVPVDGQREALDERVCMHVTVVGILF